MRAVIPLVWGIGHPNAEVAKVSQKSQTSQKQKPKNVLDFFCDFCVIFVFLLRSEARSQDSHHTCTAVMARKIASLVAGARNGGSTR
jgi:hypothetical protein